MRNMLLNLTLRQCVILIGTLLELLDGDNFHVAVTDKGYLSPV